MKYLKEFLLNSISDLTRVWVITNLCIFNTGKKLLNITTKNMYLNECTSWYSLSFYGGKYISVTIE